MFRHTKINTIITINSFYRNIDSWKSTKLVVVGDTILDQYTLCDPIGMSAEAPVIVIKEIESRNFIGGAAIVAAHIKSLGAQCELISVTGDDLESFAVKKELKNKQIEMNYGEVCLFENVRFYQEEESNDINFSKL